MMKRITILILFSLITTGTLRAQNATTPVSRAVPPPAPKSPFAPLPIPRIGPQPANPPSKNPNPIAAPLKFKWSANDGMVACRENESCIRRPFPKPIGKPISVKRGPFLNEKHAPISTLVASKNQYSLCYLSSIKANAVNVCRPIKIPIIKGAKFQVYTYSGKTSVLYFSLHPNELKGKSREEVRGILLA